MEASCALTGICRCASTTRACSTGTKHLACFRGLTRVRQFCQDDAHLFVRPSPARERGDGTPEARAFRLWHIRAELRRRALDAESRELPGDIETWEAAENDLRRALTANGVPFQSPRGGGRFLWAEDRFHVTDAIGRRWQCATIQLDYQMPERFDLTYVGEDSQSIGRLCSTAQFSVASSGSSPC